MEAVGAAASSSIGNACYGASTAYDISQMPSITTFASITFRAVQSRNELDPLGSLSTILVLAQNAEHHGQTRGFINLHFAITSESIDPTKASDPRHLRRW